MKMKNNGKVVFLIILLTIIVFLLSIFLIYTLKNGIDFKRFSFSFGTQKAEVVFEKEYEIGEFKNISIAYDYGDITFEESSNNIVQVKIWGDKDDNYNVDVSDEILDINYKTKNKTMLFGFNNVKRDIVISIPKDYSNKIAIKNNYGDCKFIDLENAELNLDCDYGDIEIGKIQNTNIQCDYGNVKIKEVLNRCDISCNYGDVEIEKMSIKEDSEIKVDLGDVEIKETNEINVEAEIDLGDKKVNNINRKSDITLKIKCDLGDIDVN